MDLRAKLMNPITRKGEKLPNGKPPPIWARLRIAYFAILIAAGVCIGTNLIDLSGNCFSSSMPYRRQTEAMLHGHIALSTSPQQMERDMVWFNGRVQQVWGLGVPCWRLLFEAPTRLLGDPAFPDRIAFAIALALLTYAVLSRFVFPNARIFNSEKAHLPVALFLTVLFPPFLSLCRVQLNVYEEAAAYAYIAGVAMFLGTLAFVERPRLRLYLILCFCGGFLALIRPTTGIYGFASLVVAWFVSRQARWEWWKSLMGPALFGVGIVLLLWTNQQRFGSFLEFGHRLNLSATNCEFISQFDNPYAKEPMWSSARELVGSLFFTRELNGFEAFQQAVQWQSPTVRYRAIYHTTFDWTFLVGMAAGWVFTLRRGLRWRRTRELQPTDRIVLTAGVWSLLSFLALFGFYLRFGMIFSRYLVDFSPAIGAALFGAVVGLRSRWKENASNARRLTPAVVILAAAMAWWIFEALNIKVERYGETMGQTNVVALLNRPPISETPLPTRYVKGEDLHALYGIPFNGEGWLLNGEVGWVVTLFVRNLNQLSLELAPAPSTSLSDSDCASIRVRAGQEFLRLESVRSTEHGKQLTFAAPTNEGYRKGIQVIFVAFSTEATYQRQPPPFSLLTASWTEFRSQGPDQSLNTAADVSRTP